MTHAVGDVSGRDTDVATGLVPALSQPRRLGLFGRRRTWATVAGEERAKGNAVQEASPLRAGTGVSLIIEAGNRWHWPIEAPGDVSMEATKRELVALRCIAARPTPMWQLEHQFAEIVVGLGAARKNAS